MKVIITHDVDHWNTNDHYFKDLFIPKFLLRNTAYMIKGSLSKMNYRKRLSMLSSNRMERLNEVIEFDLLHGIKPSCFIGFRNALNLSYNLSVANKIVLDLAERKIPYYPHGIAFNNDLLMAEEKKRYNDASRASGLEVAPQGIRMHYLRYDGSTRQILNSLGYSFCSNEYALKDPYRVDGIWEFPVSMMEVYEISYADNDPSLAIERSKQRIIEAEKKNLKYFTLIFHDHHFSEAFWQYSVWYREIIQFLSNRFEFTSFEQALNILNNEQN